MERKRGSGLSGEGDPATALYNTDQVTFTMTSGAPFAGITRLFSSFSQAAQENADSRVYAGIHFGAACRDGVALGQKTGRRAAQMFLFPTGTEREGRRARTPRGSRALQSRRPCLPGG
jgi:hypothetical protein